MHTPVLLKEALEGLNVKNDGVYIDATAGEGGHLIELAKSGGKILGIDRDKNQLKNLAEKIKNYRNVQLVQGNFADLDRIARENKFFPADGVLLDLGLSMKQIKESGLGFTYQNPAENLDMRLDRNLVYSAENIINEFSQNDLYEIFSQYGEEINSLAISNAIVRARTLKKISKVGDLTAVIDKVIRDQKTKTYARIFQALRMTVNNESINLKKALEGSLKILNRHGRIVVISFHSIEDRITKLFIRSNRLNQKNKKIITAGTTNKFERSAKLRIISK